ncbi:MAG: PepSY domain-containing protein [Caldilineaceae bacterium]|nr:PepSY domain-containing protein [Caldilineaceae bacterium]
MKVNKPVATLLFASSLVIGGLGAGALMAPSPRSLQAAPVAQDQPAPIADDQVQDPSYTGSVPVDLPATQGLSEAEEAAALQGGATITASDAAAAAVATNPGASVLETELDNENGYLVYSVELDNGVEVKVDAGNGAILASEHDDETGMGDTKESESEETDPHETDDIQDEQEGQPDDATGAPGVEDAAGQ